MKKQWCDMTRKEKWEKVEMVFEKLRAGWELSKEELELFKTEEFRKLLAEKIMLYPHEWV